ncbi:TetR/AcrR family transcriptional regulator [Gordonia desulfuricans]|uniref:TetR/AcrR family transcriptional regulator n=1 Tax=Gordonia desulfuricans TaxID=89051 RepID=A0A7K3LSF1_9ACTN|nr:MULTISPECIES: TetR/AcrR family transcriptional regulator [Gordonia]EMP14136.1 hypothetical protein ISGA_2213 [Gordonia sp. NB41Y]NDK91160.1 TetR/AcrR family transcriptional regulator [Gordonia desulfuricans]WLP88655.1 TetR/AcrR family transcriptional regulator [Gordonia sp. NB41Y]
MTETAPSATSGGEGDPETRRRLLDAAIHIASTDGLGKVTYRSVAAHAGLSHSLVRFYFGSKEAMVSEALERAAHLDADESQLRADSIDDFNRDFVTVMSGERNRGMLQYDYLLRAVRGGVPLERLVAVYDIYIGQVSATLEEIGVTDDDGSLAALVLAAVDGLVMQHAIYVSDDRSERILERLREVLRVLQSHGAADD